ncbi:MAG: hypothetical protein U5K69_13840 [Balneolaceae bacterium]|nr:hypothetical protein [Balneolaceae bacterium]
MKTGRAVFPVVLITQYLQKESNEIIFSGALLRCRYFFITNLAIISSLLQLENIQTVYAGKVNKNDVVAEVE